MRSDKNARNLRFLFDCKRFQQARRRLIAGANARQKHIFKLFLEWHRQWYLFKPWQAQHFLVSIRLFAVCGVYICLLFSGLRFVAFCGGVSARERSVGCGSIALYRAFGAVSKTYFQSRSMTYMSVSKDFAGLRVQGSRSLPEAEGVGRM